MIVWFNCKITDVRPNPQPRYYLRNDKRMDIAKYSIASMVPLLPLVSKFIFNLEFADGHAGQEKEMEDWLTSLFPQDKLSMYWFRCNNLTQWREKQREFDIIGDNYIFFCGNEDHVFMDSNIDIFSQVEAALSKDPSIYSTAITTHYPETIRASYVLQGQWDHPFVKFQTGNNDSNRIIKRAMFDWYLDQIKDDNQLIFRTEHWNNTVLPTNIAHTATKEQFRHFDGYNHVGIGADQCPPIEIPSGFFDNNIKIRYGYNDRKEGWVNINPASESLYAEDGKGADYRIVMDDLPMFWQSRISEFDVNPESDNQVLTAERDKDLLKMTRISFNWPHFGINFAHQPFPPTEWINEHTKQLLFSE